ncbi:glycosyltransferase [Psychromicrobium xiongbiense]|uniref:glycosyltransferase n=1 Tax=Psychromicrobium xiongbiense TaxID=3051184 RepID=UPI0025551686|nr:glycosyltransferase [Psychromicrobium sp. YIM S02556]
MHVTAVVVSHNGSTYMPRTLAALAGQTRPVDRAIGVDVASKDSSARLLESALGSGNVLRRSSRGGFGAAVRAGLSALTSPTDRPGNRAPESEYLWLLHDDSAPERTALAELLNAVERAPSVTIAGCKQLDAEAPRSLVDAGLSVSRRAERLTMIESDEQDQGQYDGRTDVFAVNSAGLLIRRDVWDALGGFDPALPAIGDDVDLCWRNRLAGHRVVVVPSAVMMHSRAPRPGHSEAALERAARHAEVLLRLKFAPWWALPFVWFAALLGGTGSLIAGLLFKDPGGGLRSLGATLAALFRFDVIAAGRRSAARTRRVSRSMVADLQIPAADVRAYRRALAESAVAEAERAADPERAREDAADAGSVVAASTVHEFEPSGDATDDFAALATARRLWVGAGAIFAVLLLAAVSLVSLNRLVGASAVGGGALLPLSAGLGEIWQHATGWWITLGAGWPGHGEPFDLVLWVLALLGWGNGSTAVVWLLTLALPLAGLGAWLCAGTLSRSRWPRLLAALVWAGSPVLLLSLGQGRLGALLAHLMLPWVLWAYLRALRPGPRSPWTACAAAGLGLAVVTASAPSLLPLAMVLVVLVMIFGGRRAASLWWSLVPSAALFAPFIASTLDNPRAILADPGVPLPFANAPAWQQLLGQPATLAPDAAIVGFGWLPAGVPWMLILILIIGAPLVLTAAISLLWPQRRIRLVRTLWVVVLLAVASGYGVGLLGTARTQNSIVTAFSGPSVSVAVLALLAIVVIGLDALIRRGHAADQRDSGAALAGEESSSRVWTRPLAVIASVALVAGPLLSLGVWTVQQVTGAHPGYNATVPAGSTELLPTGVRPLAATAVDRGLSADRSRSLVMTVGPDGVAQASLMRDGGTGEDALSTIVAAQGITGGFGAETVTGDDPVAASVRRSVAAITAGSGANPGDDLNALGVGFVMLRGTDSSSELLASKINTVPGLVSIGQTDQGWLWRVLPRATAQPTAATVAAARIDDGKGGTLSYLPSQPASQAEGVDTQVGQGAEGRLVVLAERADPRWSAWFNDQKLTSAAAPGAASWAQAFNLPAAAGHLEIRYEQPAAWWWGAAQVVVFALTLLLVIPLPTRRIKPASLRGVQARRSRRTSRRSVPETATSAAEKPAQTDTMRAGETA